MATTMAIMPVDMRPFLPLAVRRMLCFSWEMSFCFLRNAMSPPPQFQRRRWIICTVKKSINAVRDR